MTQQKIKSKIIGIYHKDCIDGTAAAAVLLKKFKNATLFPLSRDYTKDDLARIYKAVNKETAVYIVDFALRKNEEIEALAKLVKKIINIDHHISDAKRLNDLTTKINTLESVFDNARSGASLTWIYFFGDKNIPRLIVLIEDGDIGKFEFPEETHNSGGALMPLMNKPKEMGILFEKPISRILSDGKQIIYFMDFLIRFYTDAIKPLKLKIGPHIVIAYNATFNVERMRSTVGHILVKKHKKTVCLFRISGLEVAFSFRGLSTVNPSARELAEILGGGGHRNAAAATVYLKDFCKMIIQK